MLLWDQICGLGGLGFDEVNAFFIEYSFHVFDDDAMGGVHFPNVIP